MGYGLWLTYGLWYAFPCPPSWWTARAMGCKRLWVFWVMGYDRSDCTMIKGDNNGSISMARNPQFHNHTKHIAVQCHRVRDAINDGIIKIDSCHDPEQTANVLTKALHHFKHRKHIAEMGMKSTLEGT